MTESIGFDQRGNIEFKFYLKELDNINFLKHEFDGRINEFGKKKKAFIFTNEKDSKNKIKNMTKRKKKKNLDSWNPKQHLEKSKKSIKMIGPDNLKFLSVGSKAKKECEKDMSLSKSFHLIVFLILLLFKKNET